MDSTMLWVLGIGGLLIFGAYAAWREEREKKRREREARLAQIRWEKEERISELAEAVRRGINASRLERDEEE